MVIALWARHVSAVAEAGVKLLQGPYTGKRSVVSTRDHDAETIEFWPCVPKASKVHEKSTHPDRVHVQACLKGGAVAAEVVNFYLNPEFKGRRTLRQWTWRNRG